MTRGLGQDVPTCLTADQAGFLGGCIAQLPPSGVTPADHQAACNDYMWMADLPYCPGTERLEFAECLSADLVEGIDYCHYGDGSNLFYNGLCWGAMKDAAWWQQWINIQPCAGVSSPRPPPSQYVEPANGNGNGAEAVQGSKMMLYAGLGIGALVLIGGVLLLARK